MSVRHVASRVLFVGVIGIGGCRATHIYTLEELGSVPVRFRPSGAAPRGAVAGADVGHCTAAGLHVEATDAATGRAAFPLNVWIIQGADTLKARTNPRGAAEFSMLLEGPAEVRAWQFNYVPTRDSVMLRMGLRIPCWCGSVAGNECYFVA